MKETTEQKVKQAYQKLQSYLENIETNEEYMKLLKFQARFTNYSANNTMLIMLSKPNATYVAGYSAWTKMRRNVRKGEKAIRILAPCTYKVFEDTEQDYVNKLVGFRIANVFDIGQTEGNESDIPQVIHGLSDNGQIKEETFNQLVNLCPVSIAFRSDMKAKGSYRSDAKNITINPIYSFEQQTKTLFHEWAHYLCDQKHVKTDYATEECIAESVSFVVSDRLGLDTVNYSVPYIKTWRTYPTVMLNITETVQRLSREILQILEQSDLLKEGEVSGQNKNMEMQI